jgi:hypothetical protein
MKAYLSLSTVILCVSLSVNTAPIPTKELIAPQQQYTTGTDLRSYQDVGSFGYANAVGNADDKEWNQNYVSTSSIDRGLDSNGLTSEEERNIKQSAGAQKQNYQAYISSPNNQQRGFEKGPATTLQISDSVDQTLKTTQSGSVNLNRYYTQEAQSDVQNSVNRKSKDGSRLRGVTSGTAPAPPILASKEAVSIDFNTVPPKTLRSSFVIAVYPQQIARPVRPILPSIVNPPAVLPAVPVKPTDPAPVTPAVAKNTDTVLPIQQPNIHQVIPVPAAPVAPVQAPVQQAEDSQGFTFSWPFSNFRLPFFQRKQTPKPIPPPTLPALNLNSPLPGEVPQ